MWEMQICRREDREFHLVGFLFLLHLLLLLRLLCSWGAARAAATGGSNRDGSHSATGGHGSELLPAGSDEFRYVLALDFRQEEVDPLILCLRSHYKQETRITEMKPREIREGKRVRPDPRMDLISSAEGLGFPPRRARR